jgi:hypothetical protein
MSPLAASFGELARRFAAGERVVGSAALDRRARSWSASRSTPCPTKARARRASRPLLPLLLAASHSAMQSPASRPTRTHPRARASSSATGLGCLLTNEEYFR